MIQIHRILCPVDFSECSRRALGHAAALSRWYQADLTILHVSPLTPTIFGLEPAPSEAMLAPFDREAVGRELAAFVGETATGPTAAQLRVLGGPTVRTILALAAEAGTELIVLGTHGRTGFERLMLGSVTEKVVRRAPCPVLTVPPRAEGVFERDLFGRILCGVDFSDASRRAVDYGLSLAQEAKACVTLLHVMEWLPAESFSNYPQFDVGHYRRTVMADARSKLEELVPDDARNWCEPDTRIVSGKPYQEILRVASEERSDLIVLGVHGRGPVDRMLFGSTTQAVVRQAACPVLTIRP